MRVGLRDLVSNACVGDWCDPATGVGMGANDTWAGCGISASALRAVLCSNHCDLKSSADFNGGAAAPELMVDMSQSGTTLTAAVLLCSLLLFCVPLMNCDDKDPVDKDHRDFVLNCFTLN